MCGEISPKKFAEKSQTNFSQTCSVPEIRTGWSKSNQAHFLQAQKLIFIISKAFFDFLQYKKDATSTRQKPIRQKSIRQTINKYVNSPKH